jgi:hypothetical protein
MLGRQILLNPHGFQALLDLRQNQVVKRLTLAGSAAGGSSLRSERRSGRVGKSAGTTGVAGAFGRRRGKIIERIPGGRVWLVLGLGPSQMLADGFAIHPQQEGDLAMGVSGIVECKDCVDFGH